MKLRTLGAYGVALALFSTPGYAQEEAAEEKKAEQPAPTDEEEEASKPEAAKAEASADVGISASAKGPEGAAQTEATAAAPAAASAQRAPVYGQRSDWTITPYGYARLDGIWDNTQSFEDGIQPNLVARAGSYRGDHQRLTATARDSRLGIFVGAPEFEGLKTSGVLELDFFGLSPTDARRHDVAVFGPLRLRHAYFKLETPVVDVIGGQYFSLFGWNGHYYPATAAFLGVPAQVYHRDPQLRLEKTFRAGDLAITPAIAGVRPGQRDSGFPDAHAGLKVAFEGWKGAAISGFGRPSLVPISIAVSGLYRRFEVPAFKPEPGSEAVKESGYGVSAQAMLPVVPVSSIEDHGNALTLTGEFSMGTGIADMYTGMDGGSRFPLLPLTGMAMPAPIYSANIDPGMVTFDRNFELQTINWKALVAGLQYYLPVGGGRLWVAGIYSRIWSDNIKELTPAPSWGGIFTKMEYIDGTLGFDVTPALAFALSFQTVKQTFGDVSAPTPIYGSTPDGTLGGMSLPNTGGVAASARNNRGQLTMSFFF